MVGWLLQFVVSRRQMPTCCITLTYSIAMSYLHHQQVRCCDRLVRSFTDAASLQDGEALASGV